MHNEREEAFLPQHESATLDQVNAKRRSPSGYDIRSLVQLDRNKLCLPEANISLGATPLTVMVRSQLSLRSLLTICMLLRPLEIRVFTQSLQLKNSQPIRADILQAAAEIWHILGHSVCAKGMNYKIF